MIEFRFIRFNDYRTRTVVVLGSTTSHRHAISFPGYALNYPTVLELLKL
jgi:hypothetical protein